jgi:predicted MFS family arabinose efflux permease
VSGTTAQSAERLRHAALATGAVFALSGGVGASWVARIPAVRDQLDARPGPLGLALLCTGAGSLITMPATGRACHRWGSRRVIVWTAFGVCALVALLPHAPNLVLLGLVLLAYGGCYGAWDVAMNVHGSAVERAADRPWMPRYHAAWSAGAIIGASLGALAAHLGMSASVHLAIAAAITMVCVLAALRGFEDERRYEDHEEVSVSEGHAPKGSFGALLTRRLVLVGLITLCGTTIEGAAADWLALHLRDDVATTAAVAAAGYAVFSIAMAATRYSGTWLTDALGRVGALRLAGLVIVVGVAITATANAAPVALAGTVLWGLGTALVFPAAMSAGGETPGRPSDGIAAVSTIGYGGFLLGPPLIGLLAELTGLGHALLVLLVLAAGIVVLAPAAAPIRPRAGDLHG